MTVQWVSVSTWPEFYRRPLRAANHAGYTRRMERFNTPEQLAAHYGITLEHAVVTQFNSGCEHYRPVLRAELWTQDAILSLELSPAWKFDGYSQADAVTKICVTMLPMYRKGIELYGDDDGIRAVWEAAQANAVPIPAGRIGRHDYVCPCGRIGA